MNATIGATIIGKVSSIREVEFSKSREAIVIVLFTSADVLCSVPIIVSNEQARTVAPGDEFQINIEQRDL